MMRASFSFVHFIYSHGSQALAAGNSWNVLKNSATFHVGRQPFCSTILRNNSDSNNLVSILFILRK
jgi:hypothetical protein